MLYKVLKGQKNPRGNMDNERQETLSVVGPVVFPIGKIIRQLMNKSNLTEADLCRGVNLPQTTINRLLSCQTNDPRISTLVAIASFFCVSVEQLVGLEPLHQHSMGKVSRGHVLPVLNWEQLDAWLNGFYKMEKPLESSIQQWIKSEKELALGSFAVWTQPSMNEFFGKESLLLIDVGNSNNGYHLPDGSLILLCFDNEFMGLRQIIKEGKNIFLKRLFSPYNIVAMNGNDAIKGVVVESRKSWEPESKNRLF